MVADNNSNVKAHAHEDAESDIRTDPPVFYRTSFSLSPLPQKEGEENEAQCSGARRDLRWYKGEENLSVGSKTVLGTTKNTRRI